MSESTRTHRSEAPTTLRVGVLTISDTRDASEDSSGARIRELLEDAGHTIGRYDTVPDEPEIITSRLREWVDDSTVEAVISNGGTGIAPRDHTHDTLQALYDKVLDGFGELFRMLSFEEIGAAAMLSRASAGIVDGVPVFSLPGSRNAVELGMTKLILPELGHVVFEVRKGVSSETSGDR